MLNKKISVVIICSLQAAFLVSSLFGNRPLADRCFSDVINEFEQIDLEVAKPMSLTVSCTGNYADEDLFEEPLCIYLPIIYSEMNVKFLDAQESQILMNDRQLSGDNLIIRLNSGPLSGYDASVFSDNTIKIQNSSTGEILRYLYPDCFGVKSLISISDSTFASLASHGDIEVWNVVTGERELVIRDKNGIHSACVLYNGALACVDKVGIVKIFDLTTGSCLHCFDDNVSLPAQSIFQQSDGNLVLVFSLYTHTDPIVLEIYSQAVQNLTVEQYALFVGLQNCKKNNVSVMLHEDWVCVFNGMTNHFKTEYCCYVHNDDQDSSDTDSDNEII